MDPAACGPPSPEALFGVVELGRTEAFGGFQFMLGSRFRTRLVEHVHAHYVLGVVDAGSVEVTVRGETFVASPGSVIALQPFEPHTEIASVEEGWSFRYLYPSEAVVRAALARNPGLGQAVLAFQRPVIEDELLSACIAEAHLQLSLRKSRESTEPLLSALFARAGERHCGTPDAVGRGQQTRERIDAARRFIIECAPRRIRVPELARTAGLSEFHFNRLFREVVGLSVYAFFDRVRVARAHELLFMGYSPSQVTHVLEYADQPHFTRHFMRASCFSPKQFSAIPGSTGPWMRSISSPRPSRIRLGAFGRA